MGRDRGPHGSQRPFGIEEARGGIRVTDTNVPIYNPIHKMKRNERFVLAGAYTPKRGSMSVIPGRLVLCFFICVLGLPACDRAQQSMGRYIESAGLIVIADTQVAKSEGRLDLTVHEVLKGTTPGSITIKRTYCPYVPEGQGLVLLLSPDWTSNEFPVIEVYTEAGPIARLRELVLIYRQPSERQRLNELKADPRYREQLFDDLRVMRESGNYPIAIDLYPALDKAGQLKLIELIGYIGDARGVPVLLRALTSGRAEVRDAARSVLAFHFPDAAPAEIFHLSPAAENAAQKAFRLAKEGQTQEARPLLLDVAADNRQSEHIRMWAALELISQLDAQSRNALRRSMLPLLTRMVKEGNYLQLADAVTILRRLPHPENLELLVNAIGRKDFLQEKTPFQAAMALWELGPAKRQRVVARLARMVEDGARAQGYRTVGGAPPAPLLALAWLSGEPELRRTLEIRGGYLRDVWGAGLRPDEGAFLAGVLRKPAGLPPEAVEWIAMRLGDLQDAGDRSSCRTARRRTISLSGEFKGGSDPNRRRPRGFGFHPVIGGRRTGCRAGGGADHLACGERRRSLAPDSRCVGRQGFAKNRPRLAGSRRDARRSESPDPDERFLDWRPGRPLLDHAGGWGDSGALSPEG